MSRFISRHPLAVIAAVLLLTAFFALGLRRGLILDVSPLGFVGQGSLERAEFEAARKKFGPDDYMVIAVVCDDVFAPANLERLRTLHDKIERMKGVGEVLSLINAPYIRSVNGTVEAGRLLPASFADGARLEEARRIATTDRLYVGNFVSADARTAAFNLLYKPELPTVVRHQVTRQIVETVRQAGFRESHFAGDPFFQWQGTEAIKSDLQVFLPLTIAFIALLLWFCFRSFVAVVVPLTTIVIGLVWLLGLMAYFNAHFTILALMLPTLMLAVGCSYMIHVLNQVGIERERGRGREGEIRGQGDVPDPQSSILSPQSSIERALQFITVPVVVSALTIIAGFLSLVFTGIPAIRATGIYSAIGAAFTCILSLTFMPAMLTLLGRRGTEFRVGRMGPLVKLLEATGHWATTRQRLLYGLTAVLVVFSLIGMWRIKIDIDYFHFHKPHSEVTLGFEEINKRLSGAVNFEIIVEGKSAGAIENYETLSRIAALQGWAEGEGIHTTGVVKATGIDKTFSVVDFVKHLNRAFHDNDPKQYRIPVNANEIHELLAERDQLRAFLSEDGRTARILVRSYASGSRAMDGVIRRVEQLGRELLPEFHVYATGTFVLLNRTSDQIAGEQVQSVAIALVTIYLMLALLFHSLRVGFTALVPNLIPVLFFFGFMGWRGIALNLTTSLVASVVLGLAVDNAVQFIVRFRRLQATTDTLREAIIESMRLSGRPIIYANIALAATFAIFSISNFEPVSSFGLLSAVTIIGCLIEDLVLLPSRLTSPVFRAK